MISISDDNLIDRKICSHTLAMFTSKKLTEYEFIQCLYINDRTFLFGTRRNLEKGMELIYHHLGRFGLEMHIGQGISTSNTKCIFFPPLSLLSTLAATCCSCYKNPMSLLPHT
jgi:hypothetical protein